MTPRQILLGYIGSNVVALLMVVAARRWKNVGRAAYVVLFGWAGGWNLYLAMTTPEVYLDYARWAAEPYRTFILGWFSQHTAVAVAAIALGQLAIAVLLHGGGRQVRMGLAGAILFLVAILPLGTGAAFPATLVMAFGAGLLMRRTYRASIGAEAWRWVRRGRSGGHARPERLHVV